MTATLVGLFAVAALVTSHYRANRAGVIVFKVVAASCFVWAALSWGALAHEYGRVLLAGLVLCWLGDVLLLSEGQTTGFKCGIAAFLLGHVSYCVAFVGLGVDGLVCLGAMVVVSGLALAIHRWLSPQLPGAFRAPVLAYLVVISIMVILACGAAWQTGAWSIVVGAVGFAASDIAVARDRFVVSSFRNTVWGSPLYFGSQFVLASSVAIAFV